MLTNYVSAQEEVLGLSTSPVLMIGYGDLQLKTNAVGQNYKVLLNRVLHIPVIRHNILSIGCLDKAGSQVITGNGCIKLLDHQGRLFAKGQHINAIYYLNVEAIMLHQICATEPKASWQKWHRCLGHIGIDGLKEMYNCNLVNGQIGRAHV